MGMCHNRVESDSYSKISKSDFAFTKPIGRGALGKVWHVTHKPSKTDLALKVYIKSEIPTRESLNSVRKELFLLSTLSHPFLINLHLAFQDKKSLYLGLDLKLGGDFRFHLLRKRFSEPELKFILACVLQALGYLHSHGIIHKDVKPENVIFDSVGFAFLTDFGTTSMCHANNCEETSGTPGYMAPEVICRQNHSCVSDFFAVGVIMYEVMMGQRPYVGKGRKEIRQMMLKKQVRIRNEELPQGWSMEAADLCNKLLKRKPDRRIGARGVEEVKAHQWFGDVDEEKLKAFGIKAPFVPDVGNNFDEEYVGMKRNVEAKERFAESEFLGYFFVPNMKDS